MTRGELEQMIADYLHRTDLTAEIPGFIELATARIGRDLRSTWNTQYTVITVSSDPYILPLDFQTIRSLAVKADRGPVSLRSVGTHELNKFGNSGEPQVYNIRGRNLAIKPYQARDYEIEYFARPPALVSAASENDVLTQLPYLYLYASLYEAWVYLQDEQLAQAMLSIYTSETDIVNREDAKARTGDAPAMRAV